MSRFQLNSKLPHVGTTIFTLMSRMAADHGAINLSQGYPDFDGPEPLRELLCRHVRDGHNQYAPLAGVAKLREQIALKVECLYDHRACPEEEITVIPGATEALFCAIQAVVQPGDEVILFDPAYDSYEPAVHLCGAKAVRIPLQAPSFTPDWPQIRRAITPKTRLIIINTPHNPTGALWSDQDMQALQQMVEDTGIILLADEVYEHLVYDGQTHQSLLRYPALAERAFVVSSFGKTYHVTGWKTGYCVAPAPLMREFRKVHQFVAFVGVTPVQMALADFMEQYPAHCQELPAFYQAKRDLFCKGLERTGFRFQPAAGTYFQLVDYSAISQQKDTEFVTFLTQKIGVAAIPISVFYESPPQMHLARFCFCKEDATLQEAIERLCQI